MISGAELVLLFRLPALEEAGRSGCDMMRSKLKDSSSTSVNSKTRTSGSVFRSGLNALVLNLLLSPSVTND